MINSPVFYIIKKEFIQILRDKRMLVSATLIPIIQLILFGYIASTDIKNVKTAVYDQDKTKSSRAYIESYTSSSYFDIKYHVKSEKEIINLLDAGEILFGLNIEKGFEKNTKKLKNPNVQALLDGSNSAAASVINAYIEQINANYLMKMINESTVLPKSVKSLNPIDVRMRVLYNPELKSKNFMVPAILATLLFLASMFLTSFAVVKEKEKGTLEQLIVTPLKNWEIISGKILPFLAIGFFDVFMVSGIAVFWFNVPLNGSFPLLLIASTLFIFSSLGLGLFISTISNTLQQATMTSLLILIPSIILSGFIFPIENMPSIVQLFTDLIPMKFFLIIIRGIFAKGIGVKYLWKEIAYLFVFSILIFSLSIARFKKKLT